MICKISSERNFFMDLPVYVEKDLLISMDYELKVDGQLLDASQEGQPLQFVQGSGQIIPGLEQALYGMAVGESKEVVVPAGQGYGEVNPQAFADVPRNRFPPDIPLQIGLELQMRGPGGQAVPARIAAVNEQSVRMDMNHPLAGKELHFKVKIAALNRQ
jgi:FKBP-type peptidyl-prolyl cis-trans isomerase SlyD